jgi:NADH-quinone oxidoreductase subunit F
MIENWKSYEPVIIPDIPNLHKIEVYEDNEGYDAFRKILDDQEKWSREAVTNEVKAANIRGRGGAGFNAGLKWSFMPDPDDRPRYLACNGDESEPGTFKDRNIFEFNPHLFIEGALIAAYAMSIDMIYVYIRGEYINWVHIFEEAVQEAYDHGYLGEDILGSGFDVELQVTYGAGAYICGEETGMLESIEGKRGYPRIKPPFPAQKGLWNNPTTINNIETLANAALVMRHGADWYQSIGVEGHPGPVLYGISGDVNKPGVYEYPAGMPVMTLINEVAGGMRDGKKLKALIPGGTSTPVLRADQLEGVSMDSNSLNEAGSMMGTAGMVVMNEDTDMVELLWRITHFFHHESCGQCTPCRDGTGWLEKVMVKIKNGEGEIKDLDLLLDVTTMMEGRTICALADAAAWPVRHTINRFRDEFEAKCKEPAHAVA